MGARHAHEEGEAHEVYLRNQRPGRGSQRKEDAGGGRHPVVGVAAAVDARVPMRRPAYPRRVHEYQCDLGDHVHACRACLGALGRLDASQADDLWYTWVCRLPTDDVRCTIRTSVDSVLYET